MTGEICTCQLRLNGHVAQANDLGYAIRVELNQIQPQLAKAGLALGLLPTEYRKFAVSGFTSVATAKS